ncbi:translocation/assembly module TamB domain-containing protein [Aquimarina intermedia]|uniref:Uncharacterized protein DUF490 n=1 Tax=Aquimarina intermedia TaxID=350814 RepID=A0A5S5C876_9FLAO|nr:translocation/assembly module TamB domain-containing protein [Aquimarina intermedia]TYP74193.1 uncharacterized protein DUF490 [Aquimarina intermedia]
MIRTLTVLIAIFAILVILFSIPGIQTFFGKKLTNYLNETYDVDLSIGRIGLTYSGNLDLQEVFIRDHHKDTLIYAKAIEGSILNLKEITKGQPELGAVAIDSLDFNMKIYEGESSDNLMIFVRKFNTEKKRERSSFVLTAEDVTVENGAFSYVNENISNPEVLDFTDIVIDAEDLKVDGPDFYITTNTLSLKEARGLDVSNLQTKFSLTETQMLFRDFNLETQDSKIMGEIALSYTKENFSDFENKVDITAAFTEADMSTNDLIPFYKEFGKDHTITFDNTVLRGTLNDFKLIDANILGLDRTIIRGDLHIRNAVSDPKNFKLNGKFDNLTTNYYDLVNLLPNILGSSLPKQLYQFGSIRGTGNIMVTPNAVDLDMDFYSQLGKIYAFVLLGELENAKNATYNGNIISESFNLGQLLGKESLGKAAFNIDVDGNGFTLANLDTKIEGDISALEFNGYTYNNISVVGGLKDPVFDGRLVIDDPNIQLIFNGVVDMDKTINNYDFVANVEYIDLNTLNLFTRDSLSIFKGDVIMDMKGSGINDVVGTISFQETLYKNQKSDYYFEDFEVVSSFDTDNVRTISINSPDIIQGSVRGKFRFENVYDLFRNSIASLYTNFEPVAITDDEFMEFNFNIYNKIVDVFLPEIQFAPNTFIKGRVESNDSEFKLTFKSPSIKAFDNLFEKVDIQVDNKNPIFNTYVAIDSIDSNFYDASEFSLINVTLKDTLFMRSEFKGGTNNEDNFNLEFYHTINEDNKSVIGLRKSDFTFKGYTWYANHNKSKSDNKIIFDNRFETVRIRPISLTHKNEKIEISGVTKGSDFKDIKAVFSDVDLYKITPSLDSLRFKGVVDGNLRVFQEEGVYFPSSTITIEDLQINTSKLGELKLNVAGNESLTQYNINTKLTDSTGVKTFSAIGGIDVGEDSSNINLNIGLNGLDMSGFSALGGIVLDNLRGTASGRASVTGDYVNPNINGNLVLNNAGLRIPYLNVDLALEDNARISLNKQNFIFEDIAITDTKYNSKGTLGGFIRHKRFSKWYLGLKLDADRLLVLDTEEDEFSLYYGTAFISGDAKIHGPSDELVIDVNATTEKGTVFKIPLNESESLGESSYIHFLSPEEKKARLAGEEIIIEEVKGLELNFDLDVNRNAEVEIVIDKNTGSSLKGRGAGTLLIEINTNGKFNMWGDFYAYEGVYNFRYGAFVEKVFNVRSGGSINWDGSPTRAVLNLSAVYRTEANPAVLLENATFNKKIPVEVVVDLKGELVQPDLDFNIEFPFLNSIVKSELEYRLESESARELQALSLVTQGQFYNDFTLGQNAITGNLVERASSLVNGIFSGEDDKFQVGLNYTQGDRVLDEETSDQFGVTLSTKINNRILINGQVGVPVGGVSESVVVGNVEVEYLFNEQGTLRGKIFNRENDIQYIGKNNGYTQGVGLSYSVDFDNFNELWKKIFATREEKESLVKKDSVAVEKRPEYINFTNKKTTN